MPSEHQESFFFEQGSGPVGAPPDPLSDFFGDVAKAWNLPVGESVRVRLSDPALPELTGTLKLARPPDLPLDPRQVLHLCLNGIEFTHREIAAWNLI